MNDGVKMIFKTLIKIPFTIAVCFLVLNLFAFAYNYVRLMSYSYVVMYTAVENNYLPTYELNLLNKTLEEMTNNGVITNARIVIDTDYQGENDTSASNDRRQYGNKIKVGIAYDFKWINPLSPRQQLVNEGETFNGIDDSNNFSGYAGGSELEQRRDDANTQNGVNIIHVVPGLKYYQDLGGN